MNSNNKAQGNPIGKATALLTPTERKKAGMAVAGVFAETLLEFAGIASLLPVLYYLLDDGGNRRAAVLFGLFAFAVLAVKWAAGTALARRRNRFLLDIYRRMSLALFTTYYHRGLLFIRERGTRRLGYEVNNACLAFSQGVLAPLLRMTGDGLLLLLAVLALLCWSPTLAGVLAVSFFPAALAYIAFIRKRVQDCGQREHEARRRQWDVTADAFAGYAELEVNDAAGKPLHSFGEGLDEVSRSRLELNMLGRLPGFISELSAVAGLVLVALSGSGGEVKVALGVFAVAAFRLLPALRSVMTGWTQVKNASFCLDILEKGLRPDAVRPPGATGGSRPLHFTRDIHFAHVSFRYPERAEPVLEDFCCTIRKGEYVGIRGASGAGKSTLFNLLLGFLVPDRGEVQVDGVPLSAENAASWRAQTGYVPQRVYIFNGTLAENIALGDPHPDRERIIRLLDELGMSDWLERQPAGPDTPLGEQGEKLSGGQRQRIGMARALYRDTSLLLLDEATSALDHESEQEVQATIARLRERRPGLTILSVSHRESSLKHCGRIITIKAGSRIKSVPCEGIMHDDSKNHIR